MVKEGLEIINIKTLIKDPDKYLAHIKEENNNYEEERLLEHIEKCEKYFLHIIKEKELENIFDNLQKALALELSEKGKSKFYKLLVSTISFHDIGKINPVFQRLKMKNDLFRKVIPHRSGSEHSIYSSIIYLEYYFNEMLEGYRKKELNNEDIKLLTSFLLLNSYIISRHHSGFNNMDNYIETLKDAINNKLNEVKEILSIGYFRELKLNSKTLDKIIKTYEGYKRKNIETVQSNCIIYIYERLMLSLLIGSDYFGTSDFMNDVRIKDLGNLDEIELFMETFNDSKITKLIRKYEKEQYGERIDFTNVKDINVLRNELFLDAEKALLKNMDKWIFYLEAPTGSGKSNVANNLAYKLIEKDKKLKKIFYVYPFNTLIEQNMKNISSMYEENKEVLNKITVINSLYPIKTIKEDKIEETTFREYEKAFLNSEFLNYPMILTTHVSLFRYLFGTSKDSIFPLFQLSNSVIVLDEIQSYKNKIWIEIIEFLTAYAKVLNIKIIIMSATLPNFQLLLKSESNAVSLIENRDKYFLHELFKNRVKCDYSLVDSLDIFTDILKVINENKGKKILIEFITKNNAYKFFDLLNELKEEDKLSFDIRLITGDDNSVEREKIINEVKLKNNIILVATQVIEAGVDIDMNIGFKDISIYDSEEQFLGRINRSCLNKEQSIVYFFNLDKANLIYKEDVRKQEDLTLLNPEIQELLSSKECDKYYNLVMEKLLSNSITETKYNTMNFFKDEVNSLKFIDIEERMKLIEDGNNDINVFLNYTLPIENNTLIGEEVWEEYKSLLRNNKMNYSEKQVKLSIVKAKMNNFIFRIKTKNTFSYNDRIGELLYIFNGDDYFKNGKLDKSKFQSNVGEFI